MTGNPIVAIVQARMGSTRLPGKVLRKIGEQPMLGHVLRRVNRAGSIDRMAVATTTERQDDQIEAFCQDRGWPVHRGPEDDVLERYRQAASMEDAAMIVRITGDCPFIDPSVVDRVVEVYRANQPECVYASNTIEPRTYPRGMDTEIFSREALETAAREATLRSHREHVTPYIRERSSQFSQQAVRLGEDLSEYRLTVDTAEDLELARTIKSELPGGDLSLDDLVSFLSDHPDIAEINREIRQKEVE